MPLQQHDDTFSVRVVTSDAIATIYLGDKCVRLVMVDLVYWQFIVNSIAGHDHCRRQAKSLAIPTRGVSAYSNYQTLPVLLRLCTTGPNVHVAPALLMGLAPSLPWQHSCARVERCPDNSVCAWVVTSAQPPSTISRTWLQQC